MEQELNRRIAGVELEQEQDLDEGDKEVEIKEEDSCADTVEQPAAKQEETSALMETDELAEIQSAKLKCKDETEDKSEPQEVTGPKLLETSTSPTREETGARSAGTPTAQDETDIILEVLENIHIDGPSGKSPSKVPSSLKTFISTIRSSCNLIFVLN